MSRIGTCGISLMPFWITTGQEPDGQASFSSLFHSSSPRSQPILAPTRCPLARIPRACSPNSSPSAVARFSVPFLVSASCPGNCSRARQLSCLSWAATTSSWHHYVLSSSSTIGTLAEEISTYRHFTTGARPDCIGLKAVSTG